MGFGIDILNLRGVERAARVAFSHNDGSGQLKAGKAADGRSAKKKKTKSTIPLKPKEGLNGPPANAKRSRRSQASVTERTGKRASGRQQAERRRGCEGCESGCTVDDPIEAAKRMMKGSVPAIVEALVKQAKQGSCPHAKTLLEMTGAKFMFDDGPELHEAGESWAKLVLERMEQAEREKTQAKA